MPSRDLHRQFPLHPQQLIICVRVNLTGRSRSALHLAFAFAMNAHAMAHAMAVGILGMIIRQEKIIAMCNVLLEIVMLLHHCITAHPDREMRCAHKTELASQRCNHHLMLVIVSCITSASVDRCAECRAVITQ